MNNYLIINNNDSVFEAFGQDNEKDAVKLYLDSFLSENNKIKTIFDKVYKELSIEEMTELFFKLFDYYVDDYDKIKGIYIIGENIYGHWHIKKNKWH